MEPSLIKILANMADNKYNYEISTRKEETVKFSDNPWGYLVLDDGRFWRRRVIKKFQTMFKF